VTVSLPNRSRTGPATYDVIGLLSVILADTPSLPDAACRERPELFNAAADDEDFDEAQYRHDAAQQACHGCPALQQCREWAMSLPAHRRPSGVIAGRRPHPRRTRTNTTELEIAS
jgi:hypothetical protein